MGATDLRRAGDDPRRGLTQLECKENDAMGEKALESAKTRRLHFALSERSVARLESLAERTDASSKTDVIKSALLTFEALVGWLEEGYTFYLRDKGGHLAPIDLLIDLAPGSSSSGSGDAVGRVPATGEITAFPRNTRF